LFCLLVGSAAGISGMDVLLNHSDTSGRNVTTVRGSGPVRDALRDERLVQVERSLAVHVSY
jgi:hypothetical protein